MPRREALLPWYGYVLINLIVWAVVIATYVLAKKAMAGGPAPAVDRPGTAAFLFFIPLAFLIASLYDFFFDRIANRARNWRFSSDAQSQKAVPNGSQRLSGDSKEGSRG